MHNDFFEEVAKLRAARRMWARIMRDRFGAKNPRAWLLRAHAQTAGVSLVAQQPLNNVVRTTLQALAAVLGGTQSLHTNSFDETYALPTEEAATLALRTQQIIAEETGIPAVADPLGGSYFVEHLTDRMETEADQDHRRDRRDGRHRRRDRGGLAAARDRRLGLSVPARGRRRPAPDRRDQPQRHGRGVGAGSRRCSIDMTPERDQIEAVRAVRAGRDAARAAAGVELCRDACAGDGNVMEAVLEAARRDVTLGEICRVFRDVFGEYRDPAQI